MSAITKHLTEVALQSPDGVTRWTPAWEICEHHGLHRESVSRAAHRLFEQDLLEIRYRHDTVASPARRVEDPEHPHPAVERLVLWIRPDLGPLQITLTGIKQREVNKMRQELRYLDVAESALTMPHHERLRELRRHQVPRALWTMSQQQIRSDRARRLVRLNGKIGQFNPWGTGTQ